MADTHLGYDLPFRPRIQLRRRGPELFANFRQVLDDAVARKVDCIIHGGDLFYRSKVPQRLVEMVFKPLKKIAETGIPVFIVPGNHERARIPHSEFSIHPNIHVFTRPRTFCLKAKGRTLALSGFPFVRKDVRGQFKHLFEQTGWRQKAADCRLLCMHQSVEAAVVGPSGYVFRWGRDVIRGRDISSVFSAVLSGHIHRFQVLAHDLHGTPLGSPVFYPGAIDRISFAERDEAKGYLVFNIEQGIDKGAIKLKWEFQPLPTRPMHILKLKAVPVGGRAFSSMLERKLKNFPEDAIVNLKILCPLSDEQSAILRLEALRTIAPPTMNVTTTWWTTVASD